MSPLVDVVFLLVIFFTVSTTFRDGTGIPVSLPSAGTTVTTATGPVEVSVGADGRVELNGSVYATIDEARLPLEKALDASSQRSVVIRGDRKVDYEAVVTLLDVARRLEAKVILAIKRGEPSGSTTPE